MNLCTVSLGGERCPRPIHIKSRGLCEAHYLQMRRDKPFSLIRGTHHLTKCSFEDCGGTVVARGMCGKHYSRYRKTDEFQSERAVARPWGSSTVRDDSGFKECRNCQQWMPESQFGRDKGSPDGLNYRCRTCVKQTPRHPDSLRRGNLPSRNTLKLYNKGDDWFLTTLERQGGSCATCRTDTPPHRGWNIDHDHNCCPGVGSCGKCVRGLLCGPCNLTLGLLKDDQSTLQTMIHYLRESDCDPA